MNRIKLRSKKLKELGDRQLVEKYQAGDLDKDTFWDELLDRYYDQLRGAFYKEFYWYRNSLQDVFNESLALAYDADIFKEWHTHGYSVKNFLHINVFKWRRTKTEADHEFWKRMKRGEIFQGIDIEVVEKMDVKEQLKYRNTDLHNYWKRFDNWKKEVEDKAFEFLDLALNDPESILASKRKQGRRKVLTALKRNYEQRDNKYDEDKAKEVDMSANSFAKRKERALDDLVEELQKRGYPPEIMAHFCPVFNYRPGHITEKIENLLPEMERGETRW